MTLPQPTPGGASAEKPFLIVGEGSETVGPGLHLLRGQGHSFAAETDVGLVVMDAGPGSRVTAGMIDALRALSDAPLHALCFSHGHLGYNAGVDQWLAHAAQRGDPRPRVIAHAGVLRRHARYRETAGLQHRLAEMQFRRPAAFFERHLALHDPDETFEDRLTIGHDERRVELRWAPSETDDAIVLWSPAQRVLYGGAALIDSMPNVGTPLRTLRDPVRWARTLEQLAALRPEVAVREFGPTLRGAQRVQDVLLHTARALRWLRERTVALMNEGLDERQILARLDYPKEIFGVDWLKPTYGEPSYVVRDVYRAENGWWDRNPTSLHPAPPDRVAREVGAAITDKAGVLARAAALASRGEWQLALHVVDLLATAEGEAAEFAEARRLKAAWLRERAGQVRSYVSRNLFLSSAERLDATLPPRPGAG